MYLRSEQCSLAHAGTESPVSFPNGSALFIIHYLMVNLLAALPFPSHPTNDEPAAERRSGRCCRGDGVYRHLSLMQLSHDMADLGAS